MNFITKTKEFTEDDNHNDIYSMINDKVDNKDKILKFLNSVEPISVLPCPTTDFIKNKIFCEQSLMYYEKDGYTWSNEIIYHFEKYDLKLDEQFIDYVLNKVT